MGAWHENSQTCTSEAHGKQKKSRFNKINNGVRAWEEAISVNPVTKSFHVKARRREEKTLFMVSGCPMGT
jgi:hypothetical protein